MDAPARHPTDQTLQSYGLGQLDDLLAEAVDKHLGGCRDCRRRVAGLSSGGFLGRRQDARRGTGNPTTSLSNAGQEGADAPPARPDSALPMADTLPPGLAD